MFVRPLSISLAFFVLSGISISIAATDYTDLPAYEIEIILFEHTGKNDATSEIWPDLVESVNTETPVQLHYEAEPGVPGIDHRAYYYTMIGDDNKRLMKDAEKLRKSHSYKVLKHIAWIQPGLPEEQAEFVAISSDMETDIDTGLNNLVSDLPNDSLKTKEADNIVIVNTHSADKAEADLDGTVKVVLGRFLHVYFDLNYRRNLSTESGVIKTEFGEDTYQDIRQYPVQVYRRMRSKETHYIDHPVLGILVLATPYEHPETVNNDNVSTSPVMIKLDQVPASQ